MLIGGIQSQSAVSRKAVQNAPIMYRRLWNRSVLNSYSSAILRSGKRFVMLADEKLTAFVEFESAISGRTADSMKNATSALLPRRARRR